jgi:hypothetical protein
VFIEACSIRKREEGFTREELGHRIERDKGAISTLLKNPGNWTLRTIAELANSIDFDFIFFLSDKKNRRRRVTVRGEEFESVSETMGFGLEPIEEAKKIQPPEISNRQLIIDDFSFYNKGQ